LLRRACVILLRFTPATGHEHPHLRTAIDNYRQLSQAQDLSPEAIAERLQATALEADWSIPDWQGFDSLQASMLDS